jgi:hypothetical protein
MKDYSNSLDLKGRCRYLFPKAHRTNMANTPFTSLGSYADSRMACQLIEWQLPCGFENMSSFSGND